MIENRLTSVRIFDETGYNMTSACKEAILNVDTEAGISVDDANRIFGEVGHCLSKTVRDAIVAAARKELSKASAVPEPAPVEPSTVPGEEEDDEIGETYIPETVDEEE